MLLLHFPGEIQGEFLGGEGGQALAGAAQGSLEVSPGLGTWWGQLGFDALGDLPQAQ